VLSRVLELLQPEAMGDIARRMQSSAVLAQFGLPMLRLIAGDAAHRRFLSWRLCRMSLGRSLQLMGRRYFPVWLARLCLRMMHRAPESTPR
jgi:hypothetical protein